MQLAAMPVQQSEFPIVGGVFDDGLSFKEAVEILIAAKRAANRRENYLKSLRLYLEQFSRGRENQPLSVFSTADVEDWMNRYPGANARQTWLNRLSTLFSFAVRRGFIKSNPCDRIDRVTVDRTPPAILKPEQVEKLLQACPTVCRPYFILAVFAGIRPEEIMRLNWTAVDLETKTVRVEGKTRQRRIVPLEPKAVALLSRCPLRAGNVTPSASTLRRFKRRARVILGLERFPQDLFRHTAASYLLALHKDAGKVATMLGNSGSVLLRHYHEPVTQADCERFWNL